MARCLRCVRLSCDKLELRFQTKTVESQFRASLEGHLLRAIVIGTCICFPLMVLAIAGILQPWSGPRSNDLDYSPYTVSLASAVLCLAASAVLVALASLRLRFGWFGYLPWESLAMCLCCLYIAVSLPRSEWHMTELLDGDPVKMSAANDELQGAEMDLVIRLCIKLTGICMYMPMRSCRLWIFPVAMAVRPSRRRLLLNQRP